MSSQDDVVEIYRKERDYEKCVFGEYTGIKSLNVASFILLLKDYINKMEKVYCGKWTKELPPWLLNCKEFENNRSAPVEVYEHLITIMALSGAALETYTNVDPEQWRVNPEEDKKKWED